MQKILHPQQIKTLDALTIQKEPIAPIDLMERASRAFVQAFMKQFAAPDTPILIVCGMGNNGGDGLVIARLLHELTFNVTVWYAHHIENATPENAQNLERLVSKRVIPIVHLYENAPLPELPSPTCICIDALLGIGVSRQVTGFWADCLDYLNGQPITRIAVDIPSGLLANAPTEGTAFNAHFTYSFQVPKLAFFAPENEAFVGQWTVLDIGLDTQALSDIAADAHALEASSVARLLHPRSRFGHKGTYGHALLVAGSFGKIGAAILCAKAALRAGCGLVSVHLPRCGYEIMQIAMPEAMVQCDAHRSIATAVPDLGNYQAVGVGPGLGTNALTANALEQLLKDSKQPLVLDADALNLLAKYPAMMALLPKGSLLTPHPKEFERLFGATANSFERWQLLRQKAASLGCFILLKGGFSGIATPEGGLYFNTTGNPGMATAGAGDVLTGILAGLLAQGYSPHDSLLLGVFLHGLAGDLAAQTQQQESLTADDLIQHLGRAFGVLRSKCG